MLISFRGNVMHARPPERRVHKLQLVGIPRQSGKATGMHPLGAIQTGLSPVVVVGIHRIGEIALHVNAIGATSNQLD